MAAILNPTAHSVPSGPLGSPLEPTSVAPWNQVSARSRTGGSPRSVRHLQLVAAPAASAAPPAATRRPMRTLFAGVGLAVLVAFAAVGVLPFLGADAAASTPASPTDATSPAVVDASAASAPVAAPANAAPVASAPTELVVQQGDSLWTIARRLQPRGDLRQLVDRLIERVGGTSVVRGQHIDVRGLID